MQINMQRNAGHKSSGFTLLEMSIVVVVSAVLTAATLYALDIYQKTIRHEDAKASIETSKTAINNFYISQKRYPCPANPTVLPSNANYGLEDCSMTTVAGATGSLTVLNGLVPLYVQTASVSGGPRETVSLTQYTDKTTAKNFPFADPWNQRLTYAVTKELTGDATTGLPLPDNSNRLRGTIAIVDEYGRDTGGMEKQADYVIVSHGADGIGASVEHGATKACNPAYTLENENCDGDSSFVHSLMNTNEQTPATYYDDYIGYSRTVVTSLWAQRDSTESTIYNIGEGNVGIQTTSPPTNKLQVEGDMQADRITSTKTICNGENAATCVQPKSLYDVTCPTGQVMKKVRINGNLEADCVKLEIKKNSTAKNCTGPVPVLQGLYSDGEIECSKPHS